MSAISTSRTIRPSPTRAVASAFLKYGGRRPPSAYLYDSSTDRAANGLSPSAAGGHPPMVNWDVVGDHWRGLETGLRNAGTDIQRGWKRITS